MIVLFRAGGFIYNAILTEKIANEVVKEHLKYFGTLLDLFYFSPRIEDPAEG